MVILVAILADTIVSTIAMIAITVAVFVTPINIWNQSIPLVSSSVRGNAISEKVRLGYLSCKRVSPSSHSVLPKSPNRAHQTVASNTPGNFGT